MIVAGKVIGAARNWRVKLKRTGGIPGAFVIHGQGNTEAEGIADARQKAARFLRAPIEQFSALEAQPWL